MEIIKKYKFLLIIFFVFLLCTSSVYATRGCCSWHGGVCGCDNSVGRQICCDGTYSPSCTCIYNPPPSTPTPTPLTLNISTSYHLDETNCSYTISTSWNKPLLYDKFSVSAVKTNLDKCLDPGPLPDTSETSWEFKNLSSGDYLVNVKPGNQSKWDWYFYCVKTHLPKIKPILNASIIKEEGKKYIKYSSKCANSIYADNGLGFLSIKNDKVKINPKQKTIYTLIATSKDGETSNVLLEIDPNATPTPTISLPLMVNNQSKDSSSYLGYLGGSSIAGFYLLRWFYQKIKNAKKP